MYNENDTGRFWLKVTTTLNLNYKTLLHESLTLVKVEEIIVQN